MGRYSSDSEESSRSRRKKKHRRRSSSSSSSGSRTSNRKKLGRRSRSGSWSRLREHHSREKRRRHRSSSSSSYEARRKRSRSRDRGKSYKSRRPRSRSRSRRSRSRHWQRSRSRSSEKSSRRRSRSRSRDRDKRKARGKEKAREKERDLYSSKQGDPGNIKGGLEHLSPTDQAKARLQMVLQAAEHPTIIEQIRRMKEIEAIESDCFIQQAFKTNRDIKKLTESTEAKHESAILGTATADVKSTDDKTEISELPTSIKYQDDDSLAHPNLFIDKEEAEEKWFKRLIGLRQERLMGSPVS
ncbi:serine/Arginine-related protein 53 isoform X2 [Latimeria chalumnae]|uniref:serine/Arginine-related protein 53 isoform X2 n=1 Tax=Latimeria chalumnae TaxID=7897 RepID=UPI0003C193E3|nr:PREDICTED: serine/Arginine-related protein 53 isoform X2 [Latimeria chalumnae]|eukprot:XP_006002218.1 PREDICTED: serine/Arginine-related protein 53 isoform X2 [Latimeria chalumnae]